MNCCPRLDYLFGEQQKVVEGQADAVLELGGQRGREPGRAVAGQLPGLARRQRAAAAARRAAAQPLPLDVRSPGVGDLKVIAVPHLVGCSAAAWPGGR